MPCAAAQPPTLTLLTVPAEENVIVAVEASSAPATHALAPPRTAFTADAIAPCEGCSGTFWLRVPPEAGSGVGPSSAALGAFVTPTAAAISCWRSPGFPGAAPFASGAASLPRGVVPGASVGAAASAPLPGSVGLPSDPAAGAGAAPGSAAACALGVAGGCGCDSGCAGALVALGAGAAAGRASATTGAGGACVVFLLCTMA